MVSKRRLTADAKYGARGPPKHRKSSAPQAEEDLTAPTRPRAAGYGPENTHGTAPFAPFTSFSRGLASAEPGSRDPYATTKSKPPGPPK